MLFPNRKSMAGNADVSPALTASRELNFFRGPVFNFELITILVVGSLFISLTGSTERAPRPPQISAIQRQDDDVVRVNSDLVVLNATVVDKQGQFVSGLNRSDFRVFEDGKEQKVSSFSAEETPFAAAIVIDSSGSMDTRMTLARGAAITFLEGLRDEDVAAVYSFDNKVERWQDFSPGRDLPPRVFGLHGKGMTVLNDAVLRAADDVAQRTEKRHAIVVLSDGGENFSRASSDKALEHALKANATVYAVNMSEEGPGRDIQGTMILKNLAAKSGGTYVASPGGQALRDAFAGILEELSHQYTLAYRPINRERDGKWRAVDVKISRTDAAVRTRKGYRAAKG